MDEVHNYASADLAIIVVGNKKDLEDLREVPTEEGQTFAQDHKCYFLETSALDNSDKMIEKVFMTLSEDLIVKKKEDDEVIPEPPGQRIKAAEPPSPEKSSGCC